MVSTNDSDPRLATIRALLAKAEATTFAAEAEAFTAKATELMARYSIDEALLAADGPGASGGPGGSRSVPGELRLDIFRPFVAQKAVLVHQVSEVFACRAIRLGKGSFEGGEAISVIGYRSDLDMVETLITSLFVQLTSAMTGATVRRGATASQVAAWRRSFIMGFTAAIVERLHRDRAEAERSAQASNRPGAARHRPAGTSGRAADSAPSVSLVLANRAASVDQEFRNRYPRVRSSTISSGSSAAGRNAGTSAGRRADLGAKRVGGRGALGRAG